jgi:hypothetical protein
MTAEKTNNYPTSDEREADAADRAFADHQAMTRGQGDRQPQPRAPQQSRPTPPRSGERTRIQRAGNFVRRHKVETGAGLALLAAVAWGLSNPDNGNSAPPEKAEVAESIFSVDLAPGAIIRQDPVVQDDEMAHNALFELTEAGTIVNQSRTLVYEEFRNGTWYGFGTNAVRDALADQLSDAQSQAIQDDADGIVWVNKAGVTGITTNEERAQQEQGGETFPPALPLDQEEDQ